MSVIAAGERWADDDSLRPALEDHLGAGAILSAIADRGRFAMSPEAGAALDMFQGSRESLRERVRDSAGGRELLSKGFGADVEVASVLDSTDVVPVLVGDGFVNSSRRFDP